MMFCCYLFTHFVSEEKKDTVFSSIGECHLMIIYQRQYQPSISTAASLLWTKVTERQVSLLFSSIVLEAEISEWWMRNCANKIKTAVLLAGNATLVWPEDVRVCTGRGCSMDYKSTIKLVLNQGDVLLETNYFIIFLNQWHGNDIIFELTGIKQQYFSPFRCFINHL